MDDYEAEDTTQLEEGNESNAALLQLQDAFVSALTASGALGKIRAQLRATALALTRGDDDLMQAAVGPVTRPLSLPPSAKVSLLLLYDFLQHHQLSQTAGVLEVEAGVHLLLNERASLLGDLADTPGSGSLLERVVQSYSTHPRTSSPEPPQGRHVTNGALTVANASPAGPSTKGDAAVTSPAAREPEGEDGDEDAIAAVLPADMDVQHELDRYEDSIPFSDTDGNLDAVAPCDEVERLSA